MLSKNWLHIETTNRCTLKCPACPRTVWHNLIKRPVPKADLNLDHLKSFLDCESMKEIDQFLLCGDYGDTIYYPRLFEMIKMFTDTCNPHQKICNEYNKEACSANESFTCECKTDYVIFF